MFLHLGGDVIVSKQDIIAIIDLKDMKNNGPNEEFLKIAEEEGFVKYISQKGNEKSFIMTTKNIFLSPISSATLKKRSDHFRSMLEEWEKN